MQPPPFSYARPDSAAQQADAFAVLGRGRCIDSWPLTCSPPGPLDQTFSHPSNATLEYDLFADKWKVLQPMATARDSAGVVCVGGEVLVIGGYGGRERGGLRSMERAPSDTMRCVPPCKTAMHEAPDCESSQSQLRTPQSITSPAPPPPPTLRTLVGGGHTDGPCPLQGVTADFLLACANHVRPLASLLSTVSSGSSRPLPPAATASDNANLIIHSPTAVCLFVGQVFVMGGAQGGGGQEQGILSSVEVYDCGSNSWSLVQSMRSPRFGLTGSSLGLLRRTIQPLPPP